MIYPVRLLESDLSDFDLISLDLFDTLLFRRCGHPHGVFSQLGGHLVEQGICISVSDFALARVWAEREARTQSAAEEVTLDEIYQLMRLERENSNFVMAEELCFEERNIYATRGTKRLLSRLAASGVRVVISSDMYLPRDFLYEVFQRQVGTSIAFEDFHVSSADFRTKTSGKRFLFLESHYGVPRERILHIGDNKFSDRHVPTMLGFKAELITPISDSFSRPSQSSSVEPRVAPKAWDSSFYSLEIGEDKLARYYYDLGLSLLGPLAYGIALHIHWVADRHGLNRILALMREGAFIANNFKFIRSRLEGLNLSYTVEPFFASRASTFLPKNFGQSPHTWDKELSKRLNYTQKNFAEEFFECRGEWLEPSDYKCSLGELLLKHSDYLSSLSKEQYLNFHRYFRTQYHDGDRLGIVDLGTGGTINRALEMIAPDHQFVHFLCISSERAYNSSFKGPVHSWLYGPTTSEKDNFSFSRLFARTPEWLEILMNGENRSVVRYESDSHGTPILDDRGPLNDPRVFKYIRLGVTDYLDAIVSNDHFTDGASRGLCLSEQLRVEVTSKIEKILVSPSREDISFLGCLVHEDNNGSRGAKKLINEQDLSVIDGVDLRRAVNQARATRADSCSHLYWPNGLLHSKFGDVLESIARGANIQHSIADFCHYAYERITMGNDSAVFIFGAGELGGALANFLSQRGIILDGIYDNRIETLLIAGKVRNVRRLDQTLVMGISKIVIASQRFYDEIERQLLDAGVNTERIL